MNLAPVKLSASGSSALLLSVETVSKRLDAHQVLREVTLEVRPGEFIALLGPSGCGKTTLLRLIAGFLQPDEGRIVIDGEDVTRLPPYRRPLNTVFQNYALFPHMSVLANVSYGPRRHGASRDEAKQRSLEALELVDLAGYRDRLPHELSGGQQQRVALARAIVNRPKLLLLDEPLSALDLKLRRRMQIELKHIQEKLGIAFIFVTHDQEEAMTMANRIAVMNAGRIEQAGAATEIYRAPRTRFVAEFVGEANLIPCMRAPSGDLHFALGGVDMEMPRSIKATAMIRPEDLTVLGAETRDGLYTIEGVVEDVISIGGTTTIHIKAGGISLKSARLGMSADAPRPGSAVTAGFKQSAVHLIAE
jgi:spermidine/putrescine transport system ATP-binding protein